MSDSMAHQVSLTLGDHANDFDIDAIVEELTGIYGHLLGIDDVPAQEYWAIVRKHDTKD